MKKGITFFIVLSIVLVLCAACTNKDNQKETVIEIDSEAVDKKKTVEFVYGIDSDIDDFNPMSNQMTNFITIFVFNVYEPLVYLNGNMELEMNLATSVNKIDELTYEFILRENVKFHNGQEFTAEDVINTINYINDPANGAWRSTQYSTVDKMEADGKYKLKITLSSPTPAFLDNLSYTPIFCKEDNPVDLSNTANGTGPFKFVSWTPNDKIVFEKFPDYWDAEVVTTDILTIKPYPDYTVAITNLQSGLLDALNRITVENATSIESKEGLKTVYAPTSNTVDLFEIGRHNCKPLSDPKVIEAMLLAFDANTMNETIYGGKGEILTSCYPSGVKYQYDVLSNEYNIDKAREALANSSYPDGFEFNCTLLKGYDAGEMAAIIWQSALSEINIVMNIRTEEMSVWLEQYLDRTYDMIWNQYGMVGSDPATFNSIIIEQLFDYQCSDIPELKTLVEEGKSIGDENLRKEIYEKIQAIIGEYAPVYPYLSVPLICGARDNVEGLLINGMSHVFLKHIRVN